MTEVQQATCLMLLLLVPLAMAGLALLNAALGRSHSAAHSMVAALCVISVAAVSFVVVGSRVGGAVAGWDFGEPTLDALAQLMALSLLALIPLSAGADRWRLGATCLATAIMAGLIFPLLTRSMVAPVGEGWLGSLGSRHGLGAGFLDLGAGRIQALGGIGALAVTWLLGPRRRKYAPDGAAIAIPGHNMVLAMSGCLVMVPGWIGLNGANALLFSPVRISLPLVGVNTMLAAAAAAGAAALLTRWRFGKTDASLTANGWVAGLVVSSAGCAFLSPSATLFCGAVAGILVVYSVEFLELKVGVDDPAGAISVHAVAGVWGLISLGFFMHQPGQMLAQLVGVATLLGLVLPVVYALNWCLDRVYRYRVEDDGERQGMDLYELGAGAYPEFVVHPDDARQ